MDPEEYRRKLECEILNVIEEKLKNGEMDAERAKDIAQMILNKLHPPLTLEQIHQIAPTLDDEFNELTNAIQFVLQDHEEEIKTLITNRVEKLIKSGKFNEASAIAQTITKA